MKITPIQSQYRPGGELQGRANASSFGIDTTDAERNLNDLAQHMEMRQQQDAALRVAKTTANLRMATDMDLIDSQDKAEAGAPDFTKNLMERYNQRLQAAVDAEDNPRARKLLQVKGLEIAGTYSEQGARFEAKARQDKKVMDLSMIGDQYSTLAVGNPAQYETLKTEYVAGVRASGLPGNTQEHLIMTNLATISSNMYKARLLKDPQGVIDEIKSGKGAAADLPGEAASTLLHMADGQIKHNEVKVKSATVANAKRNIDLMNSGYDGPPNGRDDILAVFGNEDEMGKTLLAEYDNAEAFGKTLKDVSMASPDELAAMHGDMQKVAADVNQDPVKRDLAVKDMTRFSAALRQRNEQIKQDPADYVLAHSEATNQAFNEFMDAQKAAGAALNDPEKVQAAVDARANYVASMKADQVRLGLPESNVALFSDRMVSQVKDRINAIERSPKGAKDAVDMLSTLHDDWGKDWPLVYRQLREKKAVDGTLDAMAYMTDPRKRSDAALLATAWANKEALSKQLDEPQKKDINDALEVVALPLGQAMSNEGRNDQFVNFKEASKLLAMQLVANGMDSKTAARTAFDKVVGSDYNVVGKMRLPKTDENGTAIDPDTVIDGSILAKKVVADQVAPVKSLAGQSDKSVAAEMPSHIEDSYWVTANGNQGLQLKWQDGAVAETKDGKPIIFTWDQLRDMHVNEQNRRRKEQDNAEMQKLWDESIFSKKKPYERPAYDPNTPMGD